MMKRKLNIELNSSNEVIEYNFKNLKSFRDVASLLEVPTNLLYEIIIQNKRRNYSEFEINKKTGGKRLIHFPKNNLAIIQKKLTSILDIVYTPHRSSHGFIKGKSIVTNASYHLKKQNVLKFDLEDFFHTINFGRVLGMFKTLFKFNHEVSTTLANVCCHHEGFLPQGAPSSPI